MTRLREFAGVLARAGRSITVKLALLLLIFITVPAIVYSQLKLADDRKTQLLRDSVAQQNRLIVEVLAPFLQKFGRDMPQNLQSTLERLSREGTNVKLLFRPNLPQSKGFFFIASAPPLSSGDLDRERQLLNALGIFGRLTHCREATDLAVRFTNPVGVEELLTSLTSVSTGTGCWAIVTSRSHPAVLRIAAAKPFWQTTSIRMAAAIYALSAILVAWLFIDVWRNMAQFSAAARTLRLRGADVAAFGRANGIPELAPVADDFDALIAAFAESQAMLKRTVEETAHALKLPLAIISQSLEPLKKGIPHSNVEAHQSIERIAHSTERLDGLVSAARDLHPSAETVTAGKRPLNVSARVEKLAGVFGRSLTNRSLRLAAEPDVHIAASEDLVEVVLENLLENAADFAPPGSEIIVSLQREAGFAALSICDEGPGVAADRLARIFDHGYTERPGAVIGGNGIAPTKHFGLGLWIVRNQVERAGGTVSVEPNNPRGLAISVRLPLA